MSAPAQGDIISFKPELDAKGHEQQGARPWLVVSIKPYNEASKLAMVCPITTHQGTAERANPAEVLHRLQRCHGNGAHDFRFALLPIDRLQLKG